MKLAFANGFSAGGWYLIGDPFADIWATGINDADPDIAQAYLAAAGPYLRDQPVAAVEVLVRRNITRFGAIRAIEDASNHDGVAYGATLNVDDATAMLRLLSHAGYNDHTARETLAGIAAAHPRLVLDHLADLASKDAILPEDTHELNNAYDTHAQIRPS